jgi:DNA helicase HerA-like ATPase
LIKFAESKMQSLFGSINPNDPSGSKAFNALSELNRTVSKINLANNKIRYANSDEEADKLEKRVETLKASAMELYSVYIQNIRTGTELEDVITYDSKETFKSVYDRLKNLRDTGIFSSNFPDLDPHASVYRYNMRYIHDDEKTMLVYYLMGKIFRSRTDAGETDQVKEIIVVDEAHKFIRSDGDNIFNIIAKEARKFGLGLWCASQSPEHFSTDFLTTVATKIILGVDPAFYDQVTRKWNMSRKVLEFITPRKTVAIYMDKKMGNASFKGVVLPGATL